MTCSFQTISCDATQLLGTSLRFRMSYQAMSCHVMSHHLTSRQVTALQVYSSRATWPSIMTETFCLLNGVRCVNLLSLPDSPSHEDVRVRLYKSLVL